MYVCSVTQQKRIRYPSHRGGSCGLALPSLHVILDAIDYGGRTDFIATSAPLFRPVLTLFFISRMIFLTPFLVRVLLGDFLCVPSALPVTVLNKDEVARGVP